MTSSFLAAILPLNGLRCIRVFRPRPKNYFFETNEEAMTFALAQDALGHKVYHACATFKDKSSAKAENIEGLQSFWLDIDCGDNKHYRDNISGVSALGAFVKAAGLPKPIIVFSGGGLHVYWPLIDSLPPAQWRGYAEGLREKVSILDFQVDPVRTCDAASVLRPVGTHNRKNGNETKVVWGSPEGPYPIEAFAGLLLVPPTGEVSPLPPRPSWIRNAEGGSYEKFRVPEAAPDPADANAIADRCAQMGAMREKQGALSEPLWRSALSILKFCDSGQSLAHDWSQGDLRYSVKETQAKLDRIQGPHKCETFRSLNPKGCEGCKFALEVSTPLELGRLPYVVLPKTSPAATETLLPEGFHLDDTGLWLASEDGKGQIVKKVVSLTPFFLKRVVQVYNEQEGVHYVLQVEKAHEEPKEITISAAKVTGSTRRAIMAASGVRITDDGIFEKYLNMAVGYIERVRKAEVIYKQFGWKDDDTAFLLGDRLYTATGIVQASNAGALQDRVRYFRPRGTLEGWTDAADMLCAPGCEAQQFAILASAAAPLMKFLAKDEGGAIYSQTSRPSSTGKSTSFDAAQSFWGDRDGLAITNIGTVKSRNAIMATGCNLPVFFDEASQRDPRLLLEFCQTFTNGRAGDGLLPDGTLRQNPMTWQTILLCGSNVPMLEILGVTGGSHAMMHRILEVIPSLPASLKENGEEKREQMKRNAGNAADRYLRYLVQPGVLEPVKAALPFNYNQIAGDFPREARFLVRLIASVKVAGNILKHLNILHCDPSMMVEWAIDKAKRQLSDVAHYGKVNAVASYLNTYPNDVLTTMNEGRKAGMLLHRPAREVRGRYETQTGMLYIAISPFRKWLAEHDYSYREVCDELKRDGASLEMKLVTLTAGITEMPPCGQVQCLALKSEIAGISFDQELGSNVVGFKR
jgi:hypothetical protein